MSKPWFSLSRSFHNFALEGEADIGGMNAINSSKDWGKRLMGCIEDTEEGSFLPWNLNILPHLTLESALRLRKSTSYMPVLDTDSTSSMLYDFGQVI